MGTVVATGPGVDEFKIGAGFTTTSISVHDAIKSIDVPVIECHVTNIFAREAFRHQSVIAAPRSSSGKTTITLGLLRAFQRRGVAVRGLKCGPDYIDPAFHAAPAVNQASISMPGR